MEEMILKVLLVLQVHHPSMALELDLVKDPFQPHDKGGSLLIIPLADFIEVLHDNVKGSHCAKNN